MWLVIKQDCWVSTWSFLCPGEILSLGRLNTLTPSWEKSRRLWNPYQDSCSLMFPAESKPLHLFQWTMRFMVFKSQACFTSFQTHNSRGIRFSLPFSFNVLLSNQIKKKKVSLKPFGIFFPSLREWLKIHLPQHSLDPFITITQICLQCRKIPCISYICSFCFLLQKSLYSIQKFQERFNYLQYLLTFLLYIPSLCSPAES